MDEKEMENISQNTSKLNRAQRRALKKASNARLRVMKETVERWSKRKSNEGIIPSGATLTETLKNMSEQEQIEFYAKMYKAVIDKRIALQEEEKKNGINED